MKYQDKEYYNKYLNKQKDTRYECLFIVCHLMVAVHVIIPKIGESLTYVFFKTF